MTRKGGKKSARRHVVFVLALFLGMGVLVALASLREPLHLVTEEPPEITQKRTDTASNAYYVFSEAAAILPEPPQPLKVKEPNGFEYFYKAEPESLGQMLDIQRPDNDPLFLKYLDDVLPALEKAVSAYDKPWFYYPPYGLDYEGTKKRNGDKNRIIRLADLMLVEAFTRPCSEDARYDACAWLHNTARLLWMVRTDGPAGFIDPKLSAAIILKASPSHQAGIEAWLKHYRAEWQPQHNEIDRFIRGIYATTLETGSEKVIWPVRVFWGARISQFKRRMHENEAQFRELNCMTMRQYDQYIAHHPVLRDKPFSADSYNFRANNSYFFLTVDSLLTVLALESFHRDTGAYPASLDELVPKYLAQLPENEFRPEPYAYAKIGADFSLACPGELRRGNDFAYVIHTPAGQSPQ